MDEARLALRFAKPTAAVRALARRPPGPWFKVPLECEACGARWIGLYQKPPEVFGCLRCERRAAHRLDDEWAESQPVGPDWPLLPTPSGRC